MTNINRIYATLLLIRYIMVPAKVARRCSQPPANGDITRIPPAAFATVLPTLDSCLQPDGGLELLFEGACAPAAPFLLYQLKRQGFSDCKAVIALEGIIVTARR